MVSTPETGGFLLFFIGAGVRSRTSIEPSRTARESRFSTYAGVAPTRRYGRLPLA